MKPILEVRNISKRYSLQHREAYLSFRDRIANILTPHIDKEEFWALNSVTFDVLTGESIGIIGKNGAGKSTLLKILSKITPPTSGKIVSRGRVASLLEVGTGFHPELTGRENIYFNGSLLGMKRRVIEKKFDQIVDFSGVERFLDTPLKHYSSGMQLRLAFSVAAFLEPEILVIDEVLAVGDAEFQKKCMGKMGDVTRSGRTILFVSHDLTAVEKLCRKTILLAEGRISLFEETSTVIERYLYNEPEEGIFHELTPGVILTKFEFGTGRISSGSKVFFKIDLTFSGDRPVLSHLCLLIYTMRGFRVAILDLRDHFDKFTYRKDCIEIRGVVTNMNLVEGEYQLGIYYGINYIIAEALDLVRISVADKQSEPVNKYSTKYRGVIELEYKLTTE